MPKKAASRPTEWTLSLVAQPGKEEQGEDGKVCSTAVRVEQTVPGYAIEQCNFVNDVLGGWSKELEMPIKKLVTAKGKEVLRRMQKSSSLNITRTFKATVRYLCKL